MKYDTKVYVRRVPTGELLANYLTPGRYSEACQACPHYGRVWSCPPGLPHIYDYLEAYQEVFVIAVKVIYPEAVITRTKTESAAMQVREHSYERVKKQLLLSLLTLEKECGTAKCLGAGRCILCRNCSREAGKPCRNPQQRRYSVTGFGFDFSKILKELFDISLQWSSTGLPKYDVAVTMLAR